jgi:hypothetical protein
MATDEEVFYDTQLLRIQQDLGCSLAQAHQVYGQAFITVFGKSTSEALPMTQVEEMITSLIEFIKEFRGPV